MKFLSTLLITFFCIQSYAQNIGFTILNPNCKDTISLLANCTSGTPPYIYNTIPAAIIGNDTINEIVAGVVYTVTATDNANITYTETYLLDSNLNANINAIIPPCNGLNGFATVITTAGNAPFTYLWNNGNTTASITNFVAGTYYVCSVTDANSCTLSTFITVNQPPALSLVLSNIQNSLCNLSSTGSITFVAVGGTPPFTYLWSNGVTSATNVGLNAGVYTLSVQDGNNCMATSMATITQPSPLTFGPINMMNPGCVLNTGYIAVQAFGGIAYPNNTYDYSLNGGFNQQSTFFLANNLPAGNYTIVATDLNGCSIDTTIQLVPPNPIIFNLTADSIDCFGGNTGNIYSSVSGGFGAYYYLWNTVPAVVTSNIYNQSSGIYSCVITDANGCSSVSTISIYEPPQFSFITTPTLPNCGSNNGAISTIVNGISNYSIKVISNNGFINLNAPNLLQNLSSGVYTVTVSNNIACEISTVINLNSTNGFSINVNIPVNSCSGNDTVFVNPNGIGAPFTFSFNGASPSNQNYIVGLPAGTHTIEVFDNTLCSQIQTFNILSEINPNINLNLVNVNAGVCFGSVNEAVAFVNPAFAPYQYEWTQLPIPGIIDFDSILNTAASGDFKIKVLDQMGCYDTSSIVFGTFNLAVLSNKDSICKGEKVSLYINQTIPNISGSNFTWLPMNNLTSMNGLNNFATPNTTTTYTIISANSNYCNDTIYKTIVVKDTLLNTIFIPVLTNPNCSNSNDGAISLVSNPLNNNLTYNWSNLSTNNTLQNIPVGIYSLLVSDAASCQAFLFQLQSINANCGLISGQLVNDANNNCIKDTLELGVPNRLISLTPGNKSTYSNYNGHYSFYSNAFTNYTISVVNPLNNSNPCGTQDTFTLDAIQPNKVNDFLLAQPTNTDYFISNLTNCLVPNWGTNGLGTFIYFSSFPMVTDSVLIYAVFDTITQYGSSFPNHTYISGDTVFWNIVLPNTSSIYLNFNLPPSTAIGTLIPFTAGITSINLTDSVLWNNQIVKNFNICGSYDPNDKQVEPQGKGPEGYIAKEEDYLTYTIRFQNTGNYAAANVIVEDTLSGLLDFSDFSVLAASHNYMVENAGGGLIKFRFMNIMLPDSNSNEPESHGYIQYRIKQKFGNLAGDKIKNTAYIYFDYNAPIITNTVVNTLYDSLKNISSLKVNNSSCVLPCGNGSISMYSDGGILPLTLKIQPTCVATQVMQNNIVFLNAGTYTVNVEDAIGESYSQIFQISNPSPLTSSPVWTSPDLGSNSGKASVVPSGGSLPYFITWLPSAQQGDSAFNLAAGTYTNVITDGGGCTLESVFQIGFATNLNSSRENLFLIYPNPTLDEFNISGKVNFTHYQILDLQGRILLEEEFLPTSNKKISVQNLSNGNYVIKVGNLFHTIFRKQ
jgi:uncharacterized repeat protein (TIGR01451 family)